MKKYIHKQTGVEARQASDGDGYWIGDSGKEIVCLLPSKFIESTQDWKRRYEDWEWCNSVGYIDQGKQITTQVMRLHDEVSFNKGDYVESMEDNQYHGNIVAWEEFKNRVWAVLGQDGSQIELSELKHAKAPEKNLQWAAVITTTTNKREIYLVEYKGQSHVNDAPVVRWFKDNSEALRWKTPLFKTDDKVDVYIGDKYWLVWGDFSCQHVVASASELVFLNSTAALEVKLFSSESLAREHALLNEPIYSYKQMRDAGIGFLRSRQLVYLESSFITFLNAHINNKL